MSKDTTIEKLAKHALEDDFDIPSTTLEAIMARAKREIVVRKWRRRALWSVPLLVAASLVLMLFFQNVFSENPVHDDLSEVRDALNLLCAVDDISSTLTSLPPEEMLIAWQDAPCAALL